MGKPLMSLDDYDFYNDSLFAKLYEEVQIPVDEVVRWNDTEEMQSRAFWNNVRSQLREEDEEDDEEEDSSNEWPDIVDDGKKYAIGFEELMQRNRNLNNLWKERMAFKEGGDSSLEYVYRWES
jgi:hypothetical protein